MILPSRMGKFEVRAENKQQHYGTKLTYHMLRLLLATTKRYIRYIFHVRCKFVLANDFVALLKSLLWKTHWCESILVLMRFQRIAPILIPPSIEIIINQCASFIVDYSDMSFQWPLYLLIIFHCNPLWDMRSIPCYFEWKQGGCDTFIAVPHGYKWKVLACFYYYYQGWVTVTVLY